MAHRESELVALQKAIYNSKNPTRRYLHVSRKQWIETALQAHAIQAGTALEIGPGSGIYLPLLAKCFSSVIALDMEEAYIENAKALAQQHNNLALVIDNITASGLRSDSLDLILCTEVIEHIIDSQSVLKEIFRALKPGGVLILSTPQKFSPLELTAKIAFLPGVIDIVRKVYNEPILETGHINLMTEKTLRSQLGVAGFVIEKTEKTGVYIPLIAEFLGKLGLSIEQFIEKRIRDTFFDEFLWTQYFIVRKPS